MKTPAQQTAARCLKDARAMLGPGWNHVSREIRRALVQERVFRIVLSQDESVAPTTVLRVAHAVAEAVDALVDAEGSTD